MRGVASIDALYRFLYLFHMPAFAVLSGAVARVEVDLKLLKRIAFQLLLPYLLFQALYALAARLPGWPDPPPAPPPDCPDGCCPGGCPAIICCIIIC